MVHGYDIKDFDYVRDVLRINPGKDPEQFDECLIAMQKYIEPWWRTLHDKVQLAAQQIDEHVLLIDWHVFKSGVEAVLGRYLREKELSSENTTLIAEFKEKYAAMQQQ